ncbi:MAG: type III pantothenate kinase [Pseudomonadota bacterium]
MRLLIDAGNTRIKWVLVAGDHWLRSGVLPTSRVGSLAQQLQEWTQVGELWVSNVAGEQVAQHIRQLPLLPDAEVHFLLAQQSGCGVRNGYTNPGQLGSDRWAALVAAWHLVRKSCLVVNSGTATTIDALSEKGEFLGGLIVPGLDLMRQSLLAGTAQLQAASGASALFPINTADAICAGALQASCGAIERQYQLLGNHAAVVLSGGGAVVLQENLKLPIRVVDNLVLQGLLLIAQEAGIK